MTSKIKVESLGYLVKDNELGHVNLPAVLITGKDSHTVHTNDCA